MKKEKKKQIKLQLLYLKLKFTHAFPQTAITSPKIVTLQMKTQYQTIPELLSMDLGTDHFISRRTLEEKVAF